MKGVDVSGLQHRGRASPGAGELSLAARIQCSPWGRRAEQSSPGSHTSSIPPLPGTNLKHEPSAQSSVSSWFFSRKNSAKSQIASPPPGPAAPPAALSPLLLTRGIGEAQEGRAGTDHRLGTAVSGLCPRAVPGQRDSRPCPRAGCARARPAPALPVPRPGDTPGARYQRPPANHVSQKAQINPPEESQQFRQQEVTSR